MPITVSSQAFVFLYSIIGGMLIAFVYDAFRIKRKTVRTSNIVIYIEDFLYWVIVAGIMFAVIYYSNEGEIRGYIFIGTVLGVILYILLFSKIIIHSSLFIIRVVARILKFIWFVLTYPFRVLYKILSVPGRFLLDKLVKAGKRTRRIAKNRSAKAAMRWKMFRNKIKKI